MASYKVKIKSFEGPFDLLVYLIENARMSIYDIRVSEITGQYLDYLTHMRERDMVVGAEFLVLAATLIELISRMLLPRIRVDGVEEEDPRTDLTQRLIEYQIMKHAAGVIDERREFAALKLTKPQEDLSAFTGEPDEYLKMGMDSFMDAFKAFLYKKKKAGELEDMRERIERERMSVVTKRSMISKLLAAAKTGVLKFTQLLTGGAGKYDKVVTFVSLLEMIRAGEVSCIQERTFGEIDVCLQEKN
jgi:segregation and condensation protein A